MTGSKRKEELIDIVERLGKLSLKAAWQSHDNLGPQHGVETVLKNKFGETPLRGDVEAEAAVLETWRKSGLRVYFLSEEHGENPLKLTNRPQLTATLDGIDGSGLAKRSWGVARYGTMLGLMQGSNPSYGDYLYGGIMELASHVLYSAARGRGAWRIDADGNQTQLTTSSATTLGPESRIHINYIPGANEIYPWLSVYEKTIEKLSGIPYTQVESTAIHYADLISGKVDAVIECTRKGNLEHAAAYPLVREAGGLMFTIDGRDLAQRKFRTYGQDEHVLIISTCNQQFKNSLLKRIS